MKSLSYPLLAMPRTVSCEALDHLSAADPVAHRSRQDLVRDCRRYTELTVWGWAILRFFWEDVMLHPERVRWAIHAWLERRAGRPAPPPPPA